MELYYGIVENNLDPQRLGRVQVRVMHIHTDNKGDIPTSALPWSIVMASGNTPGISGLGHSTYLVNGSSVVGTFIDKHYQDFMVFGSLPTTSNTSSVSTTKGFSDPDGIFPKRLGTGDNNTRVRGEMDPDSEFDTNRGKYQPYSTYNPQYPRNHVYETTSGHLKEYDDTIGSERIREKHMSGTYYEIQSNGTKVERIERDNYQLVIGDDTLEVFGSVNIICSNNVNIACAGHMDAHVQGEIVIKGDMSATVNINDNINIEAGNEIKIHANTHCHILAKEDINIEADKSISIKAGENINIEAVGTLQLKGENIYLNE